MIVPGAKIFDVWMSEAELFSNNNFTQLHLKNQHLFHYLLKNLNILLFCFYFCAEYSPLQEFSIFCKKHFGLCKCPNNVIPPNCVLNISILDYVYFGKKNILNRNIIAHNSPALYGTFYDKSKLTLKMQPNLSSFIDEESKL